MTKPSDLGLFVKEWREGQWEAVCNSLHSQKRFVGQCMPTGGGKSMLLVAEALKSNKRALILTGTKPLQQQYQSEFQYLGILDVRGKSNYTCIVTEPGGEFYDKHPAKSVAEGPCQYGAECGLKNYGCTYYDKIREVQKAKLVVSNYAAYISSNLYGDGWGHFPLLLCDEVHEAESWLSKMISIEIPKAYEKAIGIKLPQSDDPVVWSNWAANTLETVRWKIKTEKERISSKRGAFRQSISLKVLKMIEKILMRMRVVDQEWIVIEEKSQFLLHPVVVYKYAEPLLFNGANKVVFASSTVVPKSLHSLGVPKEGLDFFSYPSTFPAKNRPIYFYPVTKMHYGMEEEEHIEWLDVVDNFISQRLDRKGIIHTVSFARARMILSHSAYSNLMVANIPSGATPESKAGTPYIGTKAQATLQRFRAMPPPAVLITPSMGTGISLNRKDCEYAIIPKVPFPNINDPLVIAKQEHDPDFGVFEAAKDLVQMFGRHVRDKDDRGETIILDKMFNLYRSRYKYMIPNWVWDAIQTVNVLPTPPEALK